MHHSRSFLNFLFVSVSPVLLPRSFLFPQTPLHASPPHWVAGKIFRSSFTTVHGVITRAGFFHYFDAAAETDAAFSLSLHNVTASLAAPDAGLGDCVIQLSQPNSSFFSFSGAPNVFSFRCETGTRVCEWVWSEMRRQLLPASANYFCVIHFQCSIK